MITDTLKQCKATLESYYGPQFKGLLLYGSVARNQFLPSSDIDLLVLLDYSFNYIDELYQIIELLYPIQLETDQLISVKPVPLNDFEQGIIQLYRNARREGIWQ